MILLVTFKLCYVLVLPDARESRYNEFEDKKKCITIALLFIKINYINSFKSAVIIAELLNYTEIR